MIEATGKTLNLRTMTQKEYRALWRKYEPETGVYTYNEEAVDLKFQRDSEKEDWQRTAGIFTKSDEVIGEITFSHIVFSEKRCDIDLLIATKSHRNKGLGTETVALAKKYAKEEMGMTRIYAEVSSKNIALQRVLQKNGFQHTKTGRGLLKDGGSPMTFVCVL
ncbi:MAG: GNAT family N-acetyltransferase [Ruminococcaceae bacterium]|nr:GNAT family N-acetyltransferase [Oscillospiraceae bacterium]